MDHGHFAPPETEEANKLVARMIQLILVLIRRHRTFAVENPWDSFLWQLHAMAVLFKPAGVELILVHQCAYGAVTRKATGILTNAAWMKKVCSLCWQVRRHYHLKGSLVGLVWSYVDQQMAWRTSLAAEYPCGLVIAWSRSLIEWLNEEAGRSWMRERSYAVVGKWRNVLVLAGKENKKTKTLDGGGTVES